MIKALIHSYISLHEFVFVNNVIREYYAMKEKNRNLNTSTFYQRF